MPSTRQAALTVTLAFAASAVAQSHFPPPPVPVGNPITVDKALLGKALFWDEQLSASGTMACGTCHVFTAGGADPRAQVATNPGLDGSFGTPDDVHGSPGVVRQDGAGVHVGDAVFGGKVQATSRRAPSTINAAYENELFWDGRAATTFVDPVSGNVSLPFNAALESQAAGPPVSDVEMSHVGRSWVEIAADITPLQPLALADQVPAPLQAFVAGQTYAALFQLAFGSPGVTAERIVMAIATYERTLISDRTPFDDYLAGTGTLTAAQQNGFQVFQANCLFCHTDIDSGSHFLGPGLNSYTAVGVRPSTEDRGRYAISGLAFEDAAFKTPQLRNVALRAPYMHNGGLPSLGAVIDFYNRGGDFPPIDPAVSAITGRITAQDRADLIAFLHTLTDPRVAQGLPPFDRPRLWSEGALQPTTFGTPTVGTGGVAPRSVVVAPPYLGNDRFAMGLADAAPGTAVFLALDLQRLPTPVPMLGQEMWLVSPSLFFAGFASASGGGGPGTGLLSYPLPIPANPLLSGLPLFGEWFTFDAAGPNGITTTNAFGVQVF